MRNSYWILLSTKVVIVIVIVIARIGHSPWGFSGPILQCFLRFRIPRTSISKLGETTHENCETQYIPYALRSKQDIS